MIHPTNSRVCSYCKTEKSLTEFHTGKGAWYCKLCKRTYDKTYRKNHPKSRRNFLLKSYGISESIYEELVNKQNGACIICNEKKENTRHSNRLYVDHDHKTGSVRGLLCLNCNCALGFVKENVKTLQNMIEYLNGQN